MNDRGDPSSGMLPSGDNAAPLWDDPAPMPAGGPGRARLLQLLLVATVILSGAWLYRRGPGRPEPPVDSRAAGGGVGADAATMAAGLVPKSASIELRLLDQLGGPVTKMAVDAAGHLVLLRGRRLELYQLELIGASVPIAHLLGRSELIETPILDLAMAGERAYLLDDKYWSNQGLIEIDLGPGFRAAERAMGDRSLFVGGERRLLPLIRSRKIIYLSIGMRSSASTGTAHRLPIDPGAYRAIALDLLPGPEGTAPTEAWVLLSSRPGLEIQDVALARIALDASALKLDADNLERIAPLLARREVAAITHVVDLPPGAKDLALGASSQTAASSGSDRLYVSIAGPTGTADDPSADPLQVPASTSGILALDLSDPQSPRRVGWTPRDRPGVVVREPRTGLVYDLSHGSPAPAAATDGEQRRAQPVFVGHESTRWEVGQSVEDGRESLVLWKLPADDGWGLSIQANAEPEYGNMMSAVPLFDRSGGRKGHWRGSLGLHDSLSLSSIFNAAWTAGPEDKAAVAEGVLQDLVASEDGRMSLQPVGTQLGGTASLGLRPIIRPEPTREAVDLSSLNLPPDAVIVEQDGFTFALEPGKGLAVIERHRKGSPHVGRILDLPGARKMVGMPGGLVVLVEKDSSPDGMATPERDSRPSYEVVMLDLLDATGAVVGEPSLTEIERWPVGEVDPNLLAADGVVGQGWRASTVYLETVTVYKTLANTTQDDRMILFRHRLWESPRNHLAGTESSHSWSERLRQRFDPQPVIGTRVLNGKFSLQYGAQDGRSGGSGQPSDILAMTAHRGLLYVLDARQGLIILDAVTDPYWARVAVPVAPPDSGGKGGDALGLDLSIQWGDGRDPALTEGYVWLTGHPQYLAGLGRQVWTEAARLEPREGGGLGYRGSLELDALPPTVQRVGGGKWLPVQVEAVP